MRAIKHGSLIMLTLLHMSLGIKLSTGGVKQDLGFHGFVFL